MHTTDTTSVAAGSPADLATSRHAKNAAGSDERLRATSKVEEGAA